MDPSLFLNSPASPPKSDDITIFRAVVEAIRNVAPNVTAAALHSRLRVICFMRRREPYGLRLIALDDGERLSMLVDESGMPIYFPALFITTQMWNAGRSANTISAYLSAIKRLYVWAHASGIALEQRLSSRSYLIDPELESLSSGVGRRVRNQSAVSNGRGGHHHGADQAVVRRMLAVERE